MGVTTYAHTGLVAFGNHRASPPSSSPSTTKIIVPRPSSGVFSTGIGGAGNSRDIKDAVSLSSEELDYREQLQRDNRPVNIHFSVGDAGNKTSKISNPASSVIEKISAHFSSDSWASDGTEHLAVKFP